MITLPNPGFHYGVAYADYAAWEAANFSRLKPILGTASKCKHNLDNPKQPTPAMILGSALHVATLEPARFEQLFFICPPCDRRTKEGKEQFEKYSKEAGARLLIRQGSKEDEASLGEVEKLRGMAASIRQMKAAAPFLNGPGRNEVSMLWKDAETGLMCKARMDRHLESFDKLNGIPVVVEIKSARNASAWGFGKAVDDEAYDAQAAHYRNGVKAITGKEPLHVFVAVESSAPFDAATYTLTDTDLETGKLKIAQMLRRYAACLKSGEWPGYPDKVQVLEMPKYAGTRNYGD